MSSFLTVEDVNSTIFRDGGNLFHEIDTSKISDSVDFTDVYYDFVKVSRVNNGENYTFKFEVFNNAWFGEYYFKTVNGDYINQNGSYNSNTGVLSFTTTEPAVILVLYCHTFRDPVYWNTKRITYILKTMTVEINQSNWDATYPMGETVGAYIVPLQFLRLRDNYIVSTTVPIKKPGSSGYVLDDNVFYYDVVLIKTDFRFDCNQALTLGKVNHIALGTDTDYKPNGAFIGEYTPTITVEYNGETIPVEWDNTLNDYTFDIDLTNQVNPGNIQFKVNIKSNKVINETETHVTLPMDYVIVTNGTELKAAINTDGNHIVKIGNNFQLSGTDFVVKHDTLIIGDDKTINLNTHQIKVKEGVTFKAENLTFRNGHTAILQEKNSTVELTDCTFTTCTSPDYNGLGACIYCDLSVESLEAPDDYTTILKDCTFINNESCILHGGELTVINSKYLNTNPAYADKNNPAFLYQTDGAANITGSIFDIDYTDNTFCSNEENIGYGQALLMIGETAWINNQSHQELQGDNQINFCNSPYNNRSHVFVKYYYPQIEECVYTSPITNNEDKAIAYAVSGVDWVFKENIQVTRASTESENTTRKIRW